MSGASDTVDGQEAVCESDEARARRRDMLNRIPLSALARSIKRGDAPSRINAIAAKTGKGKNYHA